MKHFVAFLIIVSPPLFAQSEMITAPNGFYLKGLINYCHTGQSSVRDFSSFQDVGISGGGLFNNRLAIGLTMGAQSRFSVDEGGRVPQFTEFIFSYYLANGGVKKADKHISLDVRFRSSSNTWDEEPDVNINHSYFGVSFFKKSSSASSSTIPMLSVGILKTSVSGGNINTKGRGLEATLACIFKTESKSGIGIGIKPSASFVYAFERDRVVITKHRMPQVGLSIMFVKQDKIN